MYGTIVRKRGVTYAAAGTLTGVTDILLVSVGNTTDVLEADVLEGAS